MELQDILAIVIVTAATLYVTRSISRTLRGKGGCHCSQNKPSKESGKTVAKHQMGIKMTPLVTLDQVGLPQKGKSITSSGND